jgi:hypothetical protein
VTKIRVSPIDGILAIDKLRLLVGEGIPERKYGRAQENPIFISFFVDGF